MSQHDYIPIMFAFQEAKDQLRAQFQASLQADVALGVPHSYQLFDAAQVALHKHKNDTAEQLYKQLRTLAAEQVVAQEAEAQKAAHEAARIAQLRETEAQKAAQEAANVAQIRAAEQAALADANKAAHEAQLRDEAERLAQQREADQAAVAVAAAQTRRSYAC